MLGTIATGPVRRLSGPPAEVTTLVAPPGAGKTVALARWAHDTPTVRDRLLWLSLERKDDDPAALWTAVIAAARQTPCLADQAQLADLRVTRDAVEEGVVPAVLAAVSATDGHVWWVVDDLHLLTDRAALASLDLVLTHRPDNLHLILASRREPPLALHRQRLAGQLREVPAEAFALTRDETVQLLAIHGLDLGDDLVDELWARTEGWAAGLRLAIAGMLNGADPASFIAGFSGATRPVSELLVAEVLSQLPAELRRFLLLTSVSGRLTADLAEQLTGRDDAGALLEELHRRNALIQRVTPGDGPTPDFRVHELLRSYLSATLEQRDAPTWRRLHTTVADHYRARGDTLRALEHCVAAGDLDRAVACLRASGPGLVLDGRGPALERIIATMPPGWLTVPTVGLIAVECALDRWDAGLAEQRLAPFDLAVLARHDDPWLRGLVATVQLHQARMSLAAIDRLGRVDAGAVEDTGARELDLLGLLQRGIVGIRSRDRGPARRDLEQVLELCLATERADVAMVVLGNLAATTLLDADFPRLHQILQQADAIAARRGWSGTRVAAQLDLVRTSLALQRARPEEARVALTAARTAIVGQATNPDLLVAVELFTPVIEAANGGSSLGAAGRLDRLWQQLPALRANPAIAAFFAWELIRLWLRVGDVSAATTTVRRAAPLLADTGELVCLQAAVDRARGQPRSARRRLAPVLAGGTRNLLGQTVIRAWVLEARLAADAGAGPRAFTALSEAVRRTAPYGLAGLLCEDPGDVRDLLTAHRGRFGPHEEHVTATLRLTEGPGPAVTFHLTPTELEILRELPSHRSIAAIAADRQVSVNTVKTHVKAIYRKLEVTNRQQAVAVALRHGP